MSSMATIRITRSEAVRDIEALLGKVAAGAEIVIEPQTEQALAIRITGDPADPAYDTWFRAQVQASIDDPSPGVSHETMKAAFAEKRAATKSRLREADTDWRASGEQREDG